MTDKEYFRPNRIWMAVIYAMTIGVLLFVFFGPPHFWDSVAPSSEKKANEYVDSYLDSLCDSDNIKCRLELSVYDRFNGGGYFSRDSALYVSNEISCDIDKVGKKAFFDVETTSGEKPTYDPNAKEQTTIEEENISTLKHIELYIEDGKLYILRTSVGETETLTVEDRKVISGFDKLLFSDDVDFMKVPSDDYNKQKDNNSVFYTVRRTVDLSTRFGDLCSALDIPITGGYVPLNINVLLVDDKFYDMEINYNGDETCGFVIDLMEYIFGDMPLDIQVYDLITRSVIYL